METAVPRRNMFWVAAIHVAICIALLLALTTTTPQWTVWYAELLGVYAIAALAAYRWPKRARAVLRYAGAAVALWVFVFGNPYNSNATASMLALFLPWVLPLRTWQDWVRFGLLLLAIISTNSMGALLAIVAGFTLLITWSYDNGKPDYVLWAVVILTMVGLSMALFMPRATGSDTRIVFWREALELFFARPAMGWGLGSYLKRALSPNQNHANSLPFTMLAELGIIGALLYVMLGMNVLRCIFTTKDTPARLAVLIWLLHNLVDCTLWFPAVGVILAINLALLWRSGDEHPTS